MVYNLHSNFASPLHEELTKGIQVLDSGCGPGTWTFDMAEKYPASKFYGVDCSSVFPENIKPANAEFAVSNIGKEIPFPDNTFDFMFQRLLFLGLSNDDWDKCLAEAYRIIKPGGYFELVEPDMDDLVNAGPLFTEQVNIVKQLMKLRNLVPSIASELKDRLEKAGFVVKSIKGTDFKMNHTDKSGKLYWDDFKQGNLGLTYIVSKVKPEFGNEEVFSNFLDQVGVETSEYKSATKFYVFCAQKPL